jgi:hypothetical protein
MSVIPVTWDMRLGGLGLKASLGKKLVRPYINKHVGHDGIHL